MPGVERLDRVARGKWPSVGWIMMGKAARRGGGGWGFIQRKPATKLFITGIEIICFLGAPDALYHQGQSGPGGRHGPRSA